MVGFLNDVINSKVKSLLEREHAHILYTYEEETAYLQQVLGYIEDGIVSGEVVLLVENERNYHKIIQALKNRLTKEQLGLLHYVNSIQFYLSNGSYDPPAIEAYFTKTVQAYVENERAFRSWAYVEWSTLKGPVHLIEQFERIVDESVKKLPFSLICAYNTHLIPSDLYTMLLQTHPYLLDEHDLYESEQYSAQF
ncbi:MEDS domain-containing protein [Sporosarcina aquimarina]|uniref:MEDS domain-containing protein n=1 Tax=Sporosarcina aquimarina TaxID=114975 RepID=A0ABU4FVY5_9BACL|nr:MEDS domain-containing protein [Sporosarcina aquimarina]MDW0108875.1 MEDS domain-containing protein [Sporosarcina aquimarina]